MGERRQCYDHSVERLCAHWQLCVLHVGFGASGKVLSEMLGTKLQGHLELWRHHEVCVAHSPYVPGWFSAFVFLPESGLPCGLFDFLDDTVGDHDLPSCFVLEGVPCRRCFASRWKCQEDPADGEFHEGWAEFCDVD